MKKGHQEQTSGDNSVNVQAESVTMGISYTEARAIAQDVFDSNFYKLSGVAERVAKDRVTEFIDAFLTELYEKAPDAADSANDPDMQYSLFVAQREYARSGEQELGDVLIDMLVERAKEKSRSLRRIVLNEAVAVAPKLGAHHYDVLSLVFSARYVRFHGVKTPQELSKLLLESLGAFVASYRADDSTFDHLQYAGCGSLQTGSVKLGQVLRDNYPGVLSKGMDESGKEELVEMGIPIDFMIPSFHDSNRCQLAFLDDAALVERANAHGLTDEQAAKLKQILKQNLLSDSEIQEMLASHQPALSGLFETWRSGTIAHFALTSVGKAIAHANLRRKTGMTADLGIWVR